MDGKKSSIDLLLIGEELPEPVLDSLQKRLPLYSLDSTKLVVHQGMDANREFDLAQIKASILSEMFTEKNGGDSIVTAPQKINLPIPDLQKELSSLYPDLRWYTLSQGIVYNLDSTRRDTISLFTTSFSKRPATTERIKLVNWLKQRIRSDSVKLFIE